ncbi:hypothetical protein AB5I41_14365 [Sphingomonas sp. MMS24-JH45]
MVKSITAYRSVDALFGRGINSVTPTYFGDLHDERSRQFSQELQYSDTLLDDRIELLLGLYYLRERSVDRTKLFVAPGSSGSSRDFRRSSVRSASRQPLPPSST